uniref:dephospho-CoA kinase n=1 Tax=Pararhizobium sp. IMCC3301 TaxID=3067904 RepID=UPI002740AC10|nr:dephospho-CoA kinase [Pararhizobium sp. IMCC3301]
MNDLKTGPQSNPPAGPGRQGGTTVLGLTGSIGMGKSTTAELFRQEGAAVFDADAAVHELYSGPAVSPVAARFPDALRDATIDREALARLVVGDQQALSDLEAIIHPLVRQAELDFIAQHKSQGTEFVVLDIPLLFESNGDEVCDKTVVVSAPARVQQTRVLARKGMTKARFDQLLSRQMSDAEKRARADFIVSTDKGLKDAKRQVLDILSQLRK